MKEYHYNVIDLQLDDEEWRDVIGWEDLYEISNLGRVRVKSRVVEFKVKSKGEYKKALRNIVTRIRKPKLNKHTGYLIVGMNGKGKAKNVTIHSMVARAFIKNYKGEGRGKGLCVNHIDGCKTNNNVNNLEIISVGDNVRHMFETGLSTSTHVCGFKGALYNSKAKLRKDVGLSEKKMMKLIESGEIKIISGDKRAQKYNSVAIKFEGVVYESKNEFIRKTGISSYKMNKMIKENKIDLVN